MLQQTELKQISQQIIPVLQKELTKIAVTEIKKTLLTTGFQKTNGGYSQSLDSQLLERMVRVEEQLVAQGKMIETIITQMNKINAEQREYSDKINKELREDMNARFVEQREYSDKINKEQKENSDKINAEQRENSDKINAEQGKRIELLISQMDKRHKEQREDSDKRHKEQREDSDKRNAEQREDINTRFAEQKEYMNKRFTHFQWTITGGILLATLLILAFQFFLQTQTL